MILPDLPVSALPVSALPVSALADHLWQSTVFALAIWLLTLLLRDNQARIRYALWLAASLKFLVPFSLLVLLGSLLPQPRRTAAAAPEAIYSAVDLAAQPFTQWAPTPAAHPAPTPAELLAAHLPAVLLALWITGAFAVLLTWFVRWRSLNQTLRLATPAHTGRELHFLRRVEAAIPTRSPLPLRLSAELIEPGLFGIFRPVLVWPQRLTPQLHDEHIEAILTHELMHARRRDNLTAALHMLVESVLWFHPLVWWIGGRLLDERERACDEAVVQLGGRPEAYAESLLKACRFCIESPLPCVSGITGADLSQRVRSIMAAAFAAKLTLSRKLLLIAAAAAAIAAPLAIGQIAAISNALTMARFMQVRPPLPPPPPPPRPPKVNLVLRADAGTPAMSVQSQDSPTPIEFYSVASIRRSASNPGNYGGLQVHIGPTDIEASNVTLEVLIKLAYGLQDKQIAGGPPWLDSQQFDIVAKSDRTIGTGGNDWSVAQRKNFESKGVLPLQNLLAERFGLKFHFEERETSVYALVVLKGGSKLQPAGTIKEIFGSNNPGIRGVGPGHLAAIHSTTDQLTRFLSSAYSSQLGRPIINETGLTAAYDFTLRFAADQMAATAEPAPLGPSLFTALEEQLGLKLQPKKAPMRTLLIDHVEAPSDN